MDNMRNGLDKIAVTDPAKLRDDQVPGALQTLGTRLAAVYGDKIAPEDIMGITRRLSDDERTALAANATDQQRELIEGILERLEGLHFLEVNCPDFLGGCMV